MVQVVMQAEVCLEVCLAAASPVLVVLEPLMMTDQLLRRSTKLFPMNLFSCSLHFRWFTIPWVSAEFVMAGSTWMGSLWLDFLRFCVSFYYGDTLEKSGVFTPAWDVLQVAS